MWREMVSVEIDTVASGRDTFYLYQYRSDMGVVTIKTVEKVTGNVQSSTDTKLSKIDQNPFAEWILPHQLITPFEHHPLTGM